LEVLDLVIDKVSADIADLKPVEAAQRTGRALHRNADRVIDSLA